MKIVFNKLILSFLIFAFVSSLTINLISCKVGDRSKIWRPNPIMPIKKYGFENVNLDSIDIQKIFYTDDLLKEILQSLKFSWGSRKWTKYLSF